MSKKSNKHRVKKIKLQPHEVIHIDVPAALVPVVIPDPERRVVTVLPAPKEKKQGWMEYLFGPEPR